MAYSAAFDMSVDLLVKLHQLMNAGKGESREANELRAQSERPWYDMSDEEQALVDGLSTDLYSIGQQCNAAQPATNLGPFEQAVTERNWQVALNILRENENAASWDIASARGAIWDTIGQKSAAAEFIGESLRLNKNEPVLEARYLQLLVELGERDKAVARARDAVFQKTHPLLLVVGADVLLRSAVQEPKINDAKLFQALIVAIQYAMQTWREMVGWEMPSETVSSSLVRIAFCYWYLGCMDWAAFALDEALRADPLNELAQRLRPELQTIPAIEERDALLRYLQQTPPPVPIGLPINSAA